jgi:choline dehydrogenase-like flavoprotein
MMVGEGRKTLSTPPVTRIGKERGSKMKKVLAAGAAVAATTTLLLTGGGGAEAGSLTNTTVTTNTLVSAKCYRHHTTTTTQFHWDRKAGKYVAYTSPHHSTSDYIKCHK